MFFFFFVFLFFLFLVSTSQIEIEIPSKHCERHGQLPLHLPVKVGVVPNISQQATKSQQAAKRLFESSYQLPDRFFVAKLPMLIRPGGLPGGKYEEHGESIVHRRLHHELGGFIVVADGSCVRACVCVCVCVCVKKYGKTQGDKFCRRARNQVRRWSHSNPGSDGSRTSMCIRLTISSPCWRHCSAASRSVVAWIMDIRPFALVFTT